MSFFLAAITLVLSLLVTLLLAYYAYNISFALITGDTSFFKKTEVIEEISPIVDVNPVLFERELSEVLSSYRSELEKLAGQSPEAAEENRYLIDRIEKIEQMIALRPEEIASLSVISQRVSGLEGELQRIELAVQNQINNLNTLLITLFGTLVVAVLGPAILRNVSFHKTN
jgi:hypothetical protein